MNDFLKTFFDLRVIADVLPLLLTEGVKNTLLIAVLAIIFGLVLGLVLAMILLSRHWLIRLPARIYVDIFRGLPAIVTVSLVGLGLPAAHLKPFGSSPTGYAVLAVGLISAAYCSEIFRAGIQAVPEGQMQAGRSLGMTHLQTMRKIVVPQGIRNVLPALTNQFIVDIKESALVYLLGLTVGQREIYFIAFERQSDLYNSSPLVAAGLCYLMLTVPLTYFVNWWDRRLRSGRRRSPARALDPDPGDPSNPPIGPTAGAPGSTLPAVPALQTNGADA